MSKVASITISAKSRTRSGSYDTSPTATHAPKNGVYEDTNSSERSPAKTVGLTSSDSEEDKHFRRRGSSSSGSPERKRQTGSRSYDTYDQERGLIHAGRSGKMSSRQRTLEQELNTEDPSFVTSSDDALASSDDGLEDNFIPRKHSGQYYVAKGSSESEHEEGGNIYRKKNIEPPRAKSEPAGTRVKSATGKLLDNYERDQSFDNLSEGERDIEKPKTSVSILKAAYSQQAVETKPLDRYKVDEELEQIKYTMQARGMMENEDSDDGGRKQETEREVLYRKPISSIKDRFFAAASGRKVRSSSDSEDDVEDDGKKEEVVPAPQRVNEMKNQWQKKGNWEDRNKDSIEEICVPVRYVFAMKERWMQPTHWYYEVEKDEITVPSQSVSEMKSEWQRPRVWEYEENKQQVVLSEDGVTKMRQVWSQVENLLDDVDGNKENREEIIAPVKPVREMKISWQQGEPWIESEKSLLDAEKALEDINARDEIDVCQVGSARNAFKELENRRDGTSVVNKPRVNKIADPKQIMEARRQKTYGDGSEIDGMVRREGQDELSTVEFDLSQIQAAKHTFKTLTVSNDSEMKSTRRPSMKLIKQEDVGKTMDAHRRKVTAEDFDDYAEHIKPNGTHASAQYVNGEPTQPEDA
ncbi:uncharacterized protein LOC135692662 isoform X3 [Rhopilema esculentum]|uniref:uncharacterized protein LOC135692662 isoform X3 n=1 Tax=Rhopilema esculentum TaxID=499914 RepID=UPI0031DC1AF7